MQLLRTLSFIVFLCSTAQANTVRNVPSLILAVQGESRSFMAQLIGGGADVNAINVRGYTAAHYAVLRNNLPALELLLANGADPNLADNDGNRLLDLWHEHENKEMLELLHNAGAKPSFTKVEGQQLALLPPLPKDKVESQDLFQAAANNDRAAAESLLAEGAHAKAKNAEGKAPFNIAAEAEHGALAAILLQAAAGVNGIDEQGWTPLMWAITYDDWDLVRALISAGGNIHAGRGKDALDIAKLMESEAKLVEVFVAEKGADVPFGYHGETALMQAAWQGHTEAVKLSIDRGTDCNIQSEDGRTALMRAAWEGHTEAVKFLIDHGADLDIQSEDGRTALMRAAGRGHVEAAKFLIDHGADLDIQSEDGFTALMIAARQERADVVEFLIDHGADLHIQSENGTTALMLAAREGDTDIAKLLIDGGADLDVQSENGITALMLTVFQMRVDVVELLIDRGADLDLRNHEGKTALNISEEYCHFHVSNFNRSSYFKIRDMLHSAQKQQER